ncbi:Fe-S oxidoreductase [Candidatus Scalindua japonica]|uniref:Fe-S oxidoreductase n=1 Tax=Candidatus Scalindua japonica TaxID=1284222 RepID=A0A286TVI6_9BACT|nr:radical SAM protein [Candidatus Scalindua japonica]GAX59889.1 Fe-S oxidoreductase [Candidatus Scalindua japonica]
MNDKAHNILLINPWIHDFAAFDLWVKPLGLLYVGSTLQLFGYNVQLIDCLYNYGYPHKERQYGTKSFYSEQIEKPSFFNNIPRTFKRYGIPQEEFRKRLKVVPKPWMICVTSHMTYWYPGVFEVIEIIKSIFPSVPVILGGIYATLCLEHAKANSGADYVIEGAGELEVLKLADKISGKERDYYNVGKWLETEIVPAYELYPELDSVSMITSRGCPYRCSYCASFLFESKFTFRRPENVVAELEKYVKVLGVEDIAFFDDALLVDPKRHIVPILELLIKKGIHPRFHTPNGIHPKYIDRRLARLLRMAGFQTIRLGFEGTSTAVQRASKNKVSCRELETALHNLQEADEGRIIDIGIYILIGMPGQTIDEVVKAIEYINRLGAKIKMTEYSPVPGTEEFREATQLCPQVVDEPLIHNKSTFTTVGMGVDYGTFDEVKAMAKRLNAGLRDSLHA